MKNCFRILIFFIVVFFAVVLQAQVKIAVFDFLAKGVSEIDASTLTDRFRSILVNSDSFKVYEREIVDQLMMEQGFQQSGVITEESMVKLGKLIGVEQIISGNVSLISKTYTVTVKLIDIETGEIVKSASIDHIGSLDDLLSLRMNDLAIKLLEDSPSLIDAEVKDDEKEIRKSPIRFTPIQIAFINPLQLCNESRFVIGLRMNILYGKNRSVYGIDIGMFNIVAKNMFGIQAGLVNKAKKVIGLQVGLINVTNTMFGFQVGLLNYINSGPRTFLPIINVGFTL